MASYLPLVRMLSLSASHTPQHILPRPYQRASGPHFSTWRKLPTTLNRITTVALLRMQGSSGMSGMRHITDWHYKRYNKGLTQRESVVVTLSIAVFLLYFLWLRESSDIDEYMSQPIWKRLPDIDPEKAEKMMEVDKYLGLQVDHAELERYKQEYYAEQLDKLNKEQQQRKKHQEWLQATASRSATFKATQTPASEN